MRYHYYGLILCLSIIIVSGIEVFSQKKTFEETTEIKTEQSAVSSQEDLDKNLSELKTLIKQLIIQYNALSKKVDALTNQYHSLIETLNERINVLSSKVDAISRQQGLQIDVSEETTKVLPKENTMPQYIKVKVREPGQEIELCLDPTYVDMNLDIARKEITTEKKLKNQVTEKETKTEAKAASDVVKPIEEILREKLAKKETTISQEVISDLHKAQKLYYAKKYNAALNVVQKSLAKQETALGYALEGTIYFTLGDLDLAIESWQAALRLDPDMHEVRTALNRYKR